MYRELTGLKTGWINALMIYLNFRKEAEIVSVWKTIL